MVMSKERTLTQGRELPLKAFQIFGFSRRYRFPKNLDLLWFGYN